MCRSRPVATSVANLVEIFETMRKEMRVDLTELEERASGRLVATPVPQTEEYNSVSTMIFL